MSLRREFAGALVGLLAIALASSCSDNTSAGRPRIADSGTGGSVSAVGGSTGTPIGVPMPPPLSTTPTPGQLPMPTCTADCTDFPAEPILDGNVPSNAAQLFGAPDNFGGTPPCVLEPQLSTATTPGAMFPPNWLRPRFRFTASGDLFEIRVHSPIERHDLVVYTKTPNWTMPLDIWKAAAVNNAGKALSVTIRSVQSSAPGMPNGVKGDILIAPVNAGGSMVFWTVKSSEVGPESSKLMGFSVGEEGVVQTLTPATVQFDGIIHENGRDLRGTYGGGKEGFKPGDVQCVGCHTSTPDGAAVIFTDDWPWNKAIASVRQHDPGAVPDYITVGARALLKMPWLGTQSTSKGHWTAGDRLLITGYGDRGLPFSGYNNSDRIAWIDLETTADISDVVPTTDDNDAKGMAQRARNQAIQAAQGTAWGVFALEGEAAHAVTPDINNAGDSIAYVSTDDSPNGHTSYNANRADIYTVPFNARKGGAVRPLNGAADPNYYEYYPSYSADDKLIAFTRAPKKGSCPKCQDGPYYNRFGEINVISSAGDSAPTPLIANQPVQCAGDNADIGFINSWPKWSPAALAVDGNTYYFLIFSSARKYEGQFAIPRSEDTPATLDDGNPNGVRSSQLYMAALVADASGKLTSYPAVYLWNQNRVAVNGVATTIETSNLTPAWDEFQIPPVVIEIE